MSYLLRNFSNVSRPASILTNQSAPDVLAISQSRGKRTRKHDLWRKPRKPRHLGRAPSKDYNYFKKNYPTDKDLVKAEEVYLTYNRLVFSFNIYILLKGYINLHYLMFVCSFSVELFIVES